MKTPPILTSTESALWQAAQQLPAPRPGLVLTVPLALWPLYMQLHGIEPKQYQHPVLWVHKESPHE